MMHTRGPWVSQKRQNSDAVGIYDADGFIFAEVFVADNSAFNAHLIAAAPDLLAAAKLAELNFQRLHNGDSDDFYDDDHEAWGALRRAIAKAEATP